VAGRVLYVLNGFNRGGAELGLRTMLENGFLEGCDAHVFAIHEGVPELRREVEALLPPGRLTVVSGSPRLDGTAMISAFLALRTIIRSFAPDTVVLSLKQANILGRAAMLGQPGHVVSFEHIVRLEKGRLQPVYTVLLRRLSARVDEIWADCQATLSGVTAYYSSKARRKEVVPLFVAEPGTVRKASYALNAPLRIATAGRLISRKRIDTLLQAVAAMRRDGRPAALTIFGDGPDRGRLEGLARSVGVSDAVVFAGFRPAWYREAVDHDLFVHLSDEEGFCIVVAEAMMVGLPVVASPVGGVADYSTDGLDAVHCPAASPDSLAAILVALAGDEESRRALGTRAADRMSAAFGPAAARAAYANLSRTMAERSMAGAS
jgi:glycosyltransferase involved in cell wall biosynthesis